MSEITIPVNPENPPADCPNTERTETELRSWWCRPFVTGAGERWTVQVLDGGAWDRPSWQGQFPSQARAVEFALRLHRIYWSNLSSNELPLPFPFQQLLSPIPGQPLLLSSELIGPARLVSELKAEFKSED